MHDVLWPLRLLNRHDLASEHLVVRERALLERWLPGRQEFLQPAWRQMLSRPGADALSPAQIDELRDALRGLIAELSASPRTIDHWPPVGRGETWRVMGEVECTELSPWEESWLRADAFVRAATPADAWTSLGEAAGVGVSVVGSLASAIVCQPTADDAERLAGRAADGMPASWGDPDRAWVAWLGGRGPLPAGPPWGGEVIRGLAQALAGKWTPAVRQIPPGLRARPTAVRAGDNEAMTTQLMGQLIAFAQHGAPAPVVLLRSLRTVLAHSGYRPGHPREHDTRIVRRLPLVALYHHLVAPTANRARLLHSLRDVYPHVVDPPPRTFATPPDVLAALESLSRWLDALRPTGIEDLPIGER